MMIRSRLLVLSLLLFGVLFCGSFAVSAQEKKSSKIVPKTTITVTPKVSTSPSTLEIPKTTPTPTDQFGANWKETLNTNKKDYKLFFDWTPLKGSRGYSFILSKEPGEEPPVTLKTVRTEWTFKNVEPGEWYLNMIAQKRDRTWTEVYYWKINVGPETEETSNPKLTTQEQALSVKAKVESMLKNMPKLQNIEEDVLENSEKNVLGTTATNSKYTCDDTPKKCSNITCGEAYFQLYKCGNESLDTDNDGVPCENKCGSK